MVTGSDIPLCSRETWVVQEVRVAEWRVWWQSVSGLNVGVNVGAETWAIGER